MREGLRFVYRDPVMRAYALTLHARFFFASIIGTVFTLFVLRDLGAGSPRAAFGLGLVLAAGGVGAVLGNGMSQRLGRGGVGRADRRAAGPASGIPAGVVGRRRGDGLLRGRRRAVATAQGAGDRRSAGSRRFAGDRSTAGPGHFGNTGSERRIRRRGRRRIARLAAFPVPTFPVSLDPVMHDQNDERHGRHI
ncbi:hypothetical protein ABIA35_008325 [Catenulispora sp. MAP12-49]|uniref:hypothetical protein n=1 Tax=Catenulispora sp. MAP12-49 TaxID=3156302 RepID=UPI00351625E4